MFRQGPSRDTAEPSCPDAAPNAIAFKRRGPSTDCRAVCTDILHFRARVLVIQPARAATGERRGSRTRFWPFTGTTARSASHGQSPPDARARGSWWSERGQLSLIRRPRRLRGTSRRPLIGSPPRGPGARRPRAPSGRPAPRPRCRNTSRQASGRETPNAAAPGCVRRRRTRPVDGRW